MNKVIRNKILKENLIIIGFGLLLTIGGIYLNVIVYDFGWMWGLLILIPLFGLGLLVFGLYGLIYFPSNPCYKCWKKYDKNDYLINEIIEIMDRNQQKGNISNLIFSDNWIILPSEFIFVKPKDINWAYVHREGQEGSNIYNQKIKIHTNFNLTFEIQCSPIHSEKSELDNVVTKDVDFYCNQLYRLNNKIIIGYSKELEKLWNKDSENFTNNANFVKLKNKGNSIN